MKTLNETQARGTEAKENGEANDVKNGGGEEEEEEEEVEEEEEEEEE